MITFSFSDYFRGSEKLKHSFYASAMEAWIEIMYLHHSKGSFPPQVLSLHLKSWTSKGDTNAVLQIT